MQDNIFKNEKDLEDELETLTNYLSKYKASQDIAGIASELYKIGDILIKLNRFDEALNNLRESLRIHRELKDIVEESYVLAMIGKCLKLQKRYNEALESYKNAIKVIENNELEEQVLVYINYYGEIGKIYLKMGDYDNALKYFKITNEMHEKNIDKIFSDEFLRFQRVGKLGVADSLQNIGELYELKGDYDQAIEYYKQSLNYYDEIDIIDDKAIVLQKLAKIYRILEDYQNAYDVLKEASEIHYKFKDMRNFALDLEQMCEIISFEYPDEAIKLLNKCLQIYDQLSDKIKKAEIFRQIALIYREKEDLYTALEFHNKAMDIYQEYRINIAMARELRSIGEIMHDLNNNEDALEYYEKSLEIFQKLGNKIEIAGTYMNMAILYNDLQDKEKSINYIENAIKFADESNSDKLVAEFKKLKDEFLN
ncbi:MAG: tetratricopeptide repeat protein [Candidatus Helarchaeota archaeon]